MASRNMFRELSRGSRTSSPQADVYTTASDFDVNGDDQVLHSTQIMNNNTNSTANALPLPSRHSRSAEPSEDGSHEMSIELGRGIKGSARRNDDDPSLTGVMGFSIGDSDYEVTTTPPRRSSQHKGSGKLRKEATTRRASQAMQGEDAPQRAFSNARPRQLSEVLAQQSGDNNSSLGSNDFPQQTATFNARNTRFTRARNSSAQGFGVSRRGDGPQTDGKAQQTPRRAVTANATVQSDGQSWALPDTANLDRIIGKPKTATPGLYSAKSRSRFTSTGYRPQHARLEGVSIPQDEKAIFASLQILQNRYADLETEHAETQRRAKEYETQVIDLQSQVKVEQRLRRPDSALGSDEETAQTKWKKERTNLRASIESLQQRLEQSDRKVGVTSTQLKNVTMERDELVLRCGHAEQENEELEAENEEFRRANGVLQNTNDHLREEIALLERNNQDLKSVLAEYKDVRLENLNSEGKSKSSQQRNLSRRLDGTHAEDGPIKMGKQRRRSNVEDHDDITRDGSIGQHTKRHVAESVDRRVQESRSVQPGSYQRKNVVRPSRKRETNLRSSREDAEQRAPVPKRSFSAPIESDASDVPTTTELEITSKTQDRLQKRSQQIVEQTAKHEAADDITCLSSITNEAEEIGGLRKALEQERLERNQTRHASAPAQQTQHNDMTGASKQHNFVTRKSSLRDVNADFDAGTGRLSMHQDEQTRTAKAVRIQSPHTSDGSEYPQHFEDEEAGNVSMLSNTSRRRSRPTKDDETSTFIIPDITMRNPVREPIQTATESHVQSINHNKSTCTQCSPNLEKPETFQPTPVTDRDLEDLTTNTIRPSEPPPVALGKVIKQLEDEVTHLKIHQQKDINLYHQHDPALSMRQRLQLRASIDKYTNEIEARSNQIYALYDVLEGQKAAGDIKSKAEEPEVEETLQSVGMDAAEIAGRVGRSAPPNLGGLDGAIDDLSDEDQLPWGDDSDVESEVN
ncbi:hypothetical protein MBLNU230_g2901t1 [Neophaeotheca triangularis]